MTTEQLRLEIEVAAKDALKVLPATSAEVKRLAQEAKAAIPPANQFKDTMARLQADLKKTQSAAQLFGDELGGLKERQGLLRGAMLDLLDKGIAPEAKELQDLKLEYEATTVAAKDVERQNQVTSGSFIDLQGSISSIAAVKIFQTLGTAALSAGKAAIETAGNYEMLNANFETLTGSTEAATRVFLKIKQFSNVTPFNLEGTAAAGQQLMAAKVQVADLTTRLGQLGDLSLGNQQKFDSMVSSFSKMSVKGKVDLEQMNVFLEAGVPILDELARGYGKNEQAVFDMMSKGEVSTADFIAAMQRLTSEGGQFFGGMARGAQTWQGVWSTYKDSVDGVAASYGQLLLPAAKAIASVLTKLNSAISDSPILQGILAGALVTITVLLGIWAAKMALSTAKTWLAYAAEMALNAARAVGNPLLLAGIAAVGLATAGYVIYAASQNRAAEATTKGSSATKDASDSALTYSDSLKKLDESQLAAAKSAWILYATQSEAARRRAEQQIAEIDRVKKERDAASSEDLAKKRKDFEDGLKNVIGEYYASKSSNPYASLDFEEMTKIDEAKAVKSGKDIIDQIHAYYSAKRRDLAESIISEEASLAAKLSATKIDDLQLEEATQLKSIDDLRIKALAAAGLTEIQKIEIAARYATMRASVEEKYSKDIADTQKKEAAEAAAAAFDLANKARADAAALSASRVDDLELEAERALALFEGTEEAKKKLAGDYAKKIADAQIEEDKRVFAERLAAARTNRDYGTYAALSAENAAKDTQVGKIAGFAGGAVADPMSVFIDAAVEFALSLDSVQKVLNGFSTMLDGAAKIIDPLVSAGTKDFIDSILEVGSSLAQGLAPGLTILMIALKIATGIINVFVIPALKILGTVFAWLNDYVFVPIGNALISVINAIIGAINWLPNWLTGGDIAYLSYLKTTKEIASLEAEVAEKTSSVSDAMSEVKEIFDAKKDELKDAYSKNVSALKNLLELGAISASDYSSRISKVNTDYSAEVAALDASEAKQLKVLQDILDSLNAGNDISTAALHAAGVPGYAIGAVEIPQTQQAVVHKGETIIPASFASGLRRGDLTLSKTGTAPGGMTLNVDVYVGGNVTAEDDLAETIATTIMRKTKRGQMEIAR